MRRRRTQQGEQAHEVVDSAEEEEPVHATMNHPTMDHSIIGAVEPVYCGEPDELMEPVDSVEPVGEERVETGRRRKAARARSHTSGGKGAGGGADVHRLLRFGDRALESEEESADDDDR